jgi:hypothetical protein
MVLKVMKEDLALLKAEAKAKDTKAKEEVLKGVQSPPSTT